MKNINICTILILEKYHFEVGRSVRDKITFFYRKPFKNTIQHICFLILAYI